MSVIIDKATILNIVGLVIIVASLGFMFLPIYRGTLEPQEAIQQVLTLLMIGLTVLGVDVLNKSYKTSLAQKIELEKKLLEQPSVPKTTP